MGNGAVDFFEVKYKKFHIWKIIAKIIDKCYNHSMIGRAEVVSLLLEQEDRSLNPGSIGLLPILIPDWRVAQELRIAQGSDSANVRLEASRYFNTRTGLATVARLGWERTIIDPNRDLILGRCTRTLVFGEAPKDTVRRLNTSTRKVDKFLLSSDVTSPVGTLTTISTHFIGHLMDIDTQLANAGINPEPVQLERTAIENI